MGQCVVQGCSEPESITRMRRLCLAHWEQWTASPEQSRPTYRCSAEEYNARRTTALADFARRIYLERSNDKE